MIATAPGDVLVIIGSSRDDGNTAAVTSAVTAHLSFARMVDLSALLIEPYDYGEAIDDDFLPVAKAMAQAKAIVFASPVYWYAMSAQMKLFVDRLSDLTGAQKPLGKALAGRTGFLIGSGETPTPPTSFESPFADTAAYFNMRWGGMLYAQGAEIDANAAAAFAAKIAASTRDVNRLMDEKDLKSSGKIGSQQAL